MYRFEKSRGKITNLDWLTQLVSAANKGGKFLKNSGVASKEVLQDNLVLCQLS